MADSGKSFWWKEKEGRAHDGIFAVVRYLLQQQNWLQQSDLRHVRLYGNVNVTGPTLGTPELRLNSVTDRLSLNIVQSMCDTVTHKIAKARPKPMFLTDGGDFKLQKKAKLLNKFIDGQFYASRVYQFDRGPMSYRDATIMGSGFVKNYRIKKKIYAERVFPADIIVDENEGIYGNPQNKFQKAYMPKELLKSLYPKYVAQIESCKSAESLVPGHSALSNYVWVLEAWHLASEEGADDGRHVICIENCTLFDEKYKKTYFPFSKIDWSRRVLGYRAQGLAEQLTGLQVEINKILRDIQIVMHLYKPKFLLEMGSKILKSQLNNEIGGFIWYEGMKPEILVPNAVPGEWFTHLQNLYMKGYEIAGVSQLSANSKKPSGLDSGKALREYSDLESERYVLNGMMWEDLHLDMARQQIQLAKEIAEENGGNYIVTAKGQNSLEKINWKDINLSEDEYMMQLFPTNFLKDTPAGKLQDVIELSQAGMIDKAFALKLLEFPDLEAYTRLQNGPLDDILSTFEEICYDGKYTAPEPFQKLQEGLVIMQSGYLWAKSNKVPEDRLEMLRRWMQEADRLLQKAKASAMPPGMPPGSGAGGQALPAVPQAAPTNPMLPPAV